MKFLPVLILLFSCCVTHSQDFDESPKQLTKTELDNLVAFAKVYGYVRFFHPSDEALATDWDAFAVNGVKKIEAAKDSIERLQALKKLFNPIAPLMQIDRTQQISPPKFKRTDKIRYWVHNGYGTKDRDKYNIYASEVKTKDITSDDAKNAPHPDSLFYRELPGNISIIMPVTLYVTDNIIPQAEKQKEPEYVASNRSVRLAD